MLGLLLMACVPKYTGLPPITPQELWTPLPTELVWVDGVPVATLDSGGDGAPLVFIHGLSSYMGFWEYQIPAFTGTNRVLALDLPGYGASGRPDAPYTPPWYAELVVDWLDEMGIQKATFVGHSMGGQIALTLAIEHPERVNALVLSAPAGFERFEPGHAAFMKRFWNESRALESSEEEIRNNFTALVFNKNDAGVERLIEERVRMADSPEFAGTSVAVSRSIAGMLDYPVLDRLDEVQVPTLIVFGTDDHMIPNPVFNGGRTATIAERGHAAIAGSELVLVPQAGHTVHHDAPDAFNDAMKAFLEKQP